MLSIDSLEARRQRMNQGGPFDTAGNRSRYDQTMERGQQIAQQQNDIGMRERMQGRDLLTKLTMQGNDIDSRYGLAAQEAKAREQQAAQAFGHSMAQLNAEFGFKAGEAGKERSHVKSMADFEAQLREIASSNDFQRGLERLAVEHGMSREEATTAFERMLQGKQVDFANQQARDQSLHGFGQQDLRLQSQLGEQAAQSQFGRDEQMAGVRSRYDMLGQEQKFGFDKTLSDMETDRQFGYLDRQNKLAVDLNEQKFTQSQQQAMQEINQRKDEQFNMALNEARGRADNLNPHGQRLLKEIEDGVAEIEATAPKNGEEWARQAKQQLMGKIGQAMQPQLLQSKIQSIDPEGRVKGWYDQKKEWRELPPPNANSVEPVPPEIAQRGGILRGPDGQPMQYISPQKQTTSDTDPTIRGEAWITERLKQKTNDPMNPGGRYVTPEEAVAEWKQLQQAFAAPNPNQMQMPKATSGMNPAMGAGGAMAPGAQMPPQQQGMMQRGPQAQPPRPQNTMQGPPQGPPNAMQSLQQAGMQGGQQNQQQPPANPQVPVEVQNAARFVQQIAAKYPDPNAMPPEVQRALEQALSIARQFNSGGR